MPNFCHFSLNYSLLIIKINLGSQTKHFTQTNQPPLRREIQKKQRAKEKKGKGLKSPPDQTDQTKPVEAAAAIAIESVTGSRTTIARNVEPRTTTQYSSIGL